MKKQFGTIDGYDGDYLIKRIALYKDSKGISPIGKSIKHGKRVRILETSGNYVLVRRWKWSKKGYIYKKFIRELR